MVLCLLELEIEKIESPQIQEMRDSVVDILLAPAF